MSKKLVFIAMLTLLGATGRGHAFSPNGMVSASCYPTWGCTAVAHSSTNTSHIRGTADFKLDAIAARTRKLGEIDIEVARRTAVISDTSRVWPYSEVARNNYIAQLGTVRATSTIVLNGLTAVSDILDHQPQYPQKMGE